MTDLTYTSIDKDNIRYILNKKNISLKDCSLDSLAELYKELCEEHFDLAKRNSLLKFLVKCDPKYKELYDKEQFLLEAATAANLDYEDTYNEARDDGNAELMVDTIKRFGPAQLGIQQETWDKFVNTNISTLLKIVNSYGLNSNNSFLKYLKVYNERNIGIDAFLNNQRPLNILWDLEVRGDIDPKQLDFTIGDEYRIKILINPSLWAQSSPDYFIRTYQWFLQNDMSQYTKNIFIRRVFMEEPNQGRPDDKTITDMNIAIRRACFYTHYIEDLMNVAQKTGRSGDFKAFLADPNVQTIMKNIKDLKNREAKWDYSTPLNSANTLKQQIGLLSQFTVESIRDTKGQYQQSDVNPARNGEDATNVDNSNRYKDGGKYITKAIYAYDTMLRRLTGKSASQLANSGVDFAALAQGIKDGTL